MGRKRGRPRKATKTVEHEEEKPVEKQTETIESTAEAESNEEDQTTKKVAAVSLPQQSEADELSTHVELEEPGSKKPKLDAEAAGSTTASLTDNKNEVEESETAKETKKETSEEPQPEKPAGGGDTIRIERCNSSQVYKKNANVLSEELKKAFPGILIVVNPQKPRSKTFEVTLCKEDSTEVVIWTGIKKGPPRKLKFPNSEVVIESIKNNL